MSLVDLIITIAACTLLYVVLARMLYNRTRHAFKHQVSRWSFVLIAPLFAPIALVVFVLFVVWNQTDYRLRPHRYGYDSTKYEEFLNYELVRRDN